MILNVYNFILLSLSVVKNSVTSAQMPFLGKLSYFTEKLLVTSQIFVVAVFPYIYFIFLKNKVFRQIFVVDNQENTWFGKLSTTIFAVDGFDQKHYFLKLETVRHTRIVKCKGFRMVTGKILRFTPDFYIAPKYH